MLDASQEDSGMVVQQLMMRQGEKTDTIKVYVELIGRLKRGEPISLTNKMLSTELRNISGQLKLMLEAESLLHNPPQNNQIQQITTALLNPLTQDSKNSPDDARMNRLLALKVQSMAVSRAIQQTNSEETARTTAVLLKSITTLDQLRFVLQTMFRVRSLSALQRVTPDRIRSWQKPEAETKRVLWIVALVKASTYRQQAAAIMKSIGQSPSVIEERRLLVGFVGEMLGKERQMARSDEDNQERSMLAIDNSTRTVIKHSIENECRITINQNNPSDNFTRINNSLDQTIFLRAFPLMHFYFERNPQVIQAVRNTQLFKNLITSKSLFLPDIANNSYNSAQSRTKTKPRTRKNPNAYEEYLKADLVAAQKCVAICGKGLLFTKHNYGNLKSAVKFVRASDQRLEYFKSVEAKDSPTTWEFSEILCVVYGKATPRQRENEDEDPQNCFSIVMKDRTLDLSVEDSARMQEMFSFMRGLTFLLAQYRYREQEKVEKELKGLKEAKKSKQRELSELARFHEGKVQSLTQGGLLWSQLLLTTNNHPGVSENERTSKTEGLRRVSSKVSGESRRQLLK